MKAHTKYFRDQRGVRTYGTCLMIIEETLSGKKEKFALMKLDETRYFREELTLIAEHFWKHWTEIKNQD